MERGFADDEIAAEKKKEEEKAAKAAMEPGIRRGWCNFTDLLSSTSFAG